MERPDLAMFEAAAREDHAPATYMMGVMRMQGYGYTPVQPNYEQALNWFERAAIMNDERVGKTAKEAAKQLNEFLSEGILLLLALKAVLQNFCAC